ncbi:IucC family-domain-containing protein [Fennellomyces sp. T-0311]|nr:IucC family-domain-containing protein [Fennellomyces sp. T-0311]
MPVTTCLTSKNSYYGKFATTSRLISCLILDGLAPAYFYPWSVDNDKIVGLCLLFCKLPPEPTSSTPDDWFENILAVIPLRGVPSLSSTNATILNGTRCPRIELLDPWDMTSHVYGLSKSSLSTTSVTLPDSKLNYIQVAEALSRIGLQGYQDLLKDGYDAIQVWKRFLKITGCKEQPGAEPIAFQLANTMMNQIYTYGHPKPLPTLKSSTIEWEQSFLEGHPVHSLHKLRYSYPPVPPLSIDCPKLESPMIRLVSFPKKSIQLRGSFIESISPLVDAILKKTGDLCEQRAKYANCVLMPVHELQVPNIQEKFPDAIILPEENSVQGRALASVRSIAIPDVLPNFTIKVSLGVKISSLLRIIPPREAHFGPEFYEKVLPWLSYDRKILTAEREVATAIYRHSDPSIAGHCTCILREAVEYPANPHPDDDVYIPAGALTERIQRPDTDETLVTHVWNLENEEKRAAFLDRYIQLALKAFLPPCLKNGVTFEAHAQNTLARFDSNTGELKGFAIRDSGGVRIHNETLKRSCGVELDPKGYNKHYLVDSIDAVYNAFYHHVIHLHFQRLIRILGMHHNGRGWEMVRHHFSEMVPSSHPMYSYFMRQEKISTKTFLRMAIENGGSTHIYLPVPNMTLTQPQ